MQFLIVLCVSVFNIIKKLLVLQRMDLGECPKYHDLALKADYEMAAKDKDYYYDIDVSVTLGIAGIFLKKPTTIEIYLSITHLNMDI